MTKYISPEFYTFFTQLAANNHREWFNNHKHEYQKSVLEPFRHLTESVIEKMQQIDPNIHINYKQAAFRIYRDIRFSKDKSPYKLWMGAAVSRTGRKNTRFPEVYFQFGPGESFIACGLYRPDKEILQRIRAKIAQNPAIFNTINNDKQLRKYFPDGIQGEKNKRLPKGQMQVAEKQPFILNKQFFTIAYYTPEEIQINDLDTFIVNHYSAMQSFNNWLLEV